MNNSNRVCECVCVCLCVRVCFAVLRCSIFKTSAVVCRFFETPRMNNSNRVCQCVCVCRCVGVYVCICAAFECEPQHSPSPTPTSILPYKQYLNTASAHPPCAQNPHTQTVSECVSVHSLSADTGILPYKYRIVPPPADSMAGATWAGPGKPPPKQRGLHRVCVCVRVVYFWLYVCVLLSYAV